MANPDIDVLIIHPEGNFRGNPTMDGLLRELSGAGLRTVMVAWARPEIDQGAPGGAVVVLIDGWRRSVLWRLLRRPYRRPLTWFVRLFLRLPNSGVVLGVDHEGIRLADAIDARRRAARVLVSFEIFPRAEWSDAMKDAEVAACRELDLAVAQDRVRADLLSRENEIPRQRIIEVPVAPRGLPVGSQPGYLHARFDLPPQVRLAVVVGSIEPWSGLDLLTDCARRLTADWRLVLHDRYGFSGTDPSRLPADALLSTQPVPGLEGLSPLLADADVGIAFYEPTYSTPYLGDNLRHVGLASGKVSMYLQHGVPVVVNDRNLLGETVERERIGVRIDSCDDFPAALETILADLPGYRARARQFFDDRLEASKALAPLVSSLRAAAKGTR